MQGPPWGLPTNQHSMLDSGGPKLRPLIELSRHYGDISSYECILAPVRTQTKVGLLLSLSLPLLCLFYKIHLNVFLTDLRGNFDIQQRSLRVFLKGARQSMNPFTPAYLKSNPT